MQQKRMFGALALTLLGGGLLTACGDDDDATDTGSSSRVIDVTMTDNAYTPASFSVQRGETVTFRFANDGSLVHEAVFGQEGTQQQHESAMDDNDGMGDMDHGGGRDDALVVDPGETGEATETFDEAGTTLIGCHQPGHYQAGMKAMVIVNS
jgi:uncharacterized cupredoxin-like copper-binding protein